MNLQMLLVQEAGENQGWKKPDKNRYEIDTILWRLVQGNFELEQEGPESKRRSSATVSGLAWVLHSSLAIHFIYPAEERKQKA
jgi:hypothetical protein